MFFIAVRLSAADLAPEGVEFFEKKIRPVLVERCYKCHSAQAEKLKGGLYLDSREGMLKGGDTSPAIIPGDPDKSLLVETIRYRNPDSQMPPKGKLPDNQIADLVEWVKLGAPWPKQAAPLVESAKKASFDLAKRRGEHWCWQPIQSQQPPSVKNATWSTQPIDRFILAKLEQANLEPALPAGTRTLLRRLYFDLIGLPPTPQEVDDFVNDASANPWEKVVDRLVASPRFGEHWARHWLDLVRYSETLGHEFDYPNPNAWRYRDYVIRALNADVRYDQFVAEHIAGDLVDKPRRHPTEGFNESIIGTTFYWLGQRDHSPVDVRLHEAEVIDNQIDVLTKTFLGLTVACARCHDHKFDAIAAKDYYALYGVLGSSRYAQRSIDPPERLRATIENLAALKPKIRAAAAAFWTERIEALPASALATNLALIRVPAAQPISSNRTDSVFADFGQRGFNGWFVDGEAFGFAPAAMGEFIVGASNRPTASLLIAQQAHSGTLSRRLRGALRSPTFTISNRYLHIFAAGRESRINVPVDNLTMIRDPIYGGLKKVMNHDELKWITIDVDMWKGHKAYLEFSDISTPDPSDDGHKDGFSPTGWIAVSRIAFSDQASPPTLDEFASQSASTGLGEGEAEKLRQDLLVAVRAWAAIPSLPGADLTNPTNHGESAGKDQSLLTSPPTRKPCPSRPSASERIADVEPGTSTAEQLSSLVEQYHHVEATIPDPARVPTLTDGTGLDENVFVRGTQDSRRYRAATIPRSAGWFAQTAFRQAADGSSWRAPSPIRRIRCSRG